MVEALLRLQTLIGVLLLMDMEEALLRLQHLITTVALHRMDIAVVHPAIEQVVPMADLQEDIVAVVLRVDTTTKTGCPIWVQDLQGFNGIWLLYLNSKRTFTRNTQV